MLAKRLNKLLCSVLVMLVFSASITCISAKALDNGVYIADCIPHYAHPTTGVIEDSGGEGSSVLGQSMTESATYGQALIEVDPNGNMFATIRLKLMDNIRNPQFKIQENGDEAFYDVYYDVIKENYNSNESDFRFQIPDENCIVRCTFYVIAMGRDVIYYIDFSNISEGSGDFVTSVEVSQPVQPKQTEPQQQTQLLQPEETPQDTMQINQTDSSPSSSLATTTKKTVSASSALSTVTTFDLSSDSLQEAVTTTAPDATYSIPEMAEKQAKGIACFDEKGNLIDPLSNSENSSKSKNSDKTGSVAVPVAIAVGTAAVAVIARGICTWKKRRSG